MDMTVEELIAMLEMQEEILQFNHFTNEDAWELGNIMVAEARRRKMPVAISIRLNNGYTVFQYAETEPIFTMKTGFRKNTIR